MANETKKKTSTPADMVVLDMNDGTSRLFASDNLPEGVKASDCTPEAEYYRKNRKAAEPLNKAQG